MSTIGMRFLVIPVIGIYSKLELDGAFQFMLRIALQLIAQGNYCYIVVPQEADTSKWDKTPGLMFVRSSIPPKVYDVQRTSLDTAALGEMFSYHYGRYMIDAAVVMTGQQAMMLKMALASDLYHDILPVFCVEQGVSWYESEPGFKGKGFNDHLHMVGSSYSHMIWVSERDKRLYLDKALHSGLTPARVKELESKGTVASVPIDLELLYKHKKKRAKANPKVCTALFAARTNQTKHPEVIIPIFDELYRQGEPVRVEYMTQTSELSGMVYAEHNDIFKERDYIKPRYGCGVEDFYEAASAAHIFLCWSDSESYNVSVGESALLGCVFVCKDSPQHRELLGHVLTDDRFWAVDPKDAIEKIRWIIHHYHEAYSLQQSLRDYYEKGAVESSPASIISRKTEEYVRNLIFTGVFKETGQMADLAATVSKTAIYPMRFHDFLALLESECYAFVMSNQKRATHRRVPTNWMFHGILRLRLGLKDQCRNRYPVYLKGEK